MRVNTQSMDGGTKRIVRFTFSSVYSKTKLEAGTFLWNTPGFSTDIDFYKAAVNDDCLRVPPKMGWMGLDRGRGRPSPVLAFDSSGKP